MPATLLALLEGRTPASTEEPWLVWLIVCLCRQRAKQTWLMQVAERIDGQDGPIADAPGWTAQFHGIGLLLVGPAGDSVEMDFGDDQGREIDPWFFAGRVMRFESPPAAEAELRRWLGDEPLITAAMDDLRAAGHLVGKQLSAPLEALHQRIAAEAGDEAAMLRWRNALDDAPSRTRHLAWLESVLADRKRAARCFEPIASLLPRARLVERLPQLTALPDHLSARVLNWCRVEQLEVSVFAKPLVAQLDPATTHPFIGLAVCRALLGSNAAAQAIAVLRAFADVKKVAGYHGNPMIDELAFALLEYSPADALPAVRSALRGSPSCAENMAGLLCLIDLAWSRLELVSVLEDHALAPELRRRAARALAASADPAARATAAALTPPPAAASGVGYTFEQVDEAQLEAEGLPNGPELQALAHRLIAR